MWHAWFLLFPLVWVAVVFLVVLVLRRTVWRGRCGGGGYGPLGELGRRYARGEIDENEYRERRAVLTERQSS